MRNYLGLFSCFCYSGRDEGGSGDILRKVLEQMCNYLNGGMVLPHFLAGADFLK